jgi:hypothetical protein
LGVAAAGGGGGGGGGGLTGNFFFFFFFFFLAMLKFSALRLAITAPAAGRSKLPSQRRENELVHDRGNK